MKKAISFLTVLVLVLSFGIVGFADEGIATDVAPIPGAGDMAGTEGAAPIQIQPRLSYTPGTPAVGSTEAIPIKYSLAKGELFLVDAAGTIVGTDSLLIPNTTYKFDIYYATSLIETKSYDEIFTAGADLVKKLSPTDIGKNATLKVRTIKGSGVLSSTKIRTVGSSTSTDSGYKLEVVTRSNYGVKMTDVELELYVTGATAISTASPAVTLVTSRHTFQVGYLTIGEDETDVGEGGTILISNDRPVITKEYFTDIAKSANYKNVTFESEDGNWIFTGKVAGMKDTNFTYNYDPDTNLLNTYPEHDFKFLNFPAGVNFPTTGEMRIDVSDISGTARTLYAYLYRDGRLTEINGTYDSGADQLVFRTNYLGKFVISDRPITEATVPEEPEEEEVVPVPETPRNNENPHTGAAAPNAMAAIGLLSLASAAVIKRKGK